MSTALGDLWPGVENSAPDDPAPLLVAADKADEEGDPRLAYALRWCAGKRRRPYRRGNIVRRPWVWLRDQSSYRHISSKEVQRREACILPRCVFDEWGDDTCENEFKTAQHAYDQLALCIGNVREAIEVPTIVLPPAPQIVATGPVECQRCGILRARTVLDCPVCKSNEVRS